MHAPRPFGLLQYGEDLNADELAYVSQLVQQVSNFKSVSDLPSVKMVRALPEKGSVLIVDMGGNLRVITNKPIEQVKMPDEFSGFPHLSIPTFFSGVVLTAKPAMGQGVTLSLTTQCRKRLNNYQSLAPKEVTLKRFVIEHNPYFAEFIPQNPPVSYVLTQYATQRPTWYSGAIAEVMQIVGGYGITDLERLPNERYEQAKLAIPKSVMKKIAEELDGGILPAYYGRAIRQFQYDYKFAKTELVGFSPNGSAWLIRVSPSGVFAMPLPLIPATTTKAFKAWAEDVQDDEIIAILNRFGGLPSGESFPVFEDFNAWQKAGVIIKMSDTGDFYDNNAFYSACGWSANLNATEMVNTCYSFENESGWAIGKMYIGYFSYGDLENHGYFPKNSGLSDAVDDDIKKAKQYADRVAELFSSNSAQDLAVQYKLRRASIQLLFNRANGVVFDEAKEKEYWQDLILEPIAVHFGNIYQWREDYLYAKEKPQNQPQIKFPEPFLGGCISHDFGRADIGTQKTKFPDMDCPMFAYFVGNDMKTVHYFKDWVKLGKPAEDNYSECMTVGQWDKTEWMTQTDIECHFYHSDFDDREEIAEQERHTQIKGTDRGYDHTPFFAFGEMFSRVGRMWRNRYFSHKTNVITTSGRNLEVAICVPFFCRNAVLHANKNGYSGANKTVSQNLYSIQDPNTYGFWTHDSVFHWRDTLKDSNGIVRMDGNPYPKNANPVWVEVHHYEPTACSDFADNGDWVGGMPADYTWLIHPNADAYLMSGGGGAPKIEEYSETVKEKAFYSDSGSLKCSIGDYADVVFENKSPDKMYFEMSPSELGNIFYKDADCVLFGEADYYSVSEYTDDYMRFFKGASMVARRNANNHFIGVINE